MEAVIQSAEDRLLLLEDALEDVLGSLPGLDVYSRSRFAEFSRTSTLEVVFDWPEQRDFATSNMTMNTYTFEATLYRWARKRDEAQRFISLTLLRIQDINRNNPRLNDSCLKWSLANMGAPRFMPGSEGAAPILFKPFRITCEAREI